MAQIAVESSHGSTIRVIVKSPADIVIEAFGGVRATARAIGRQPGCVSKWRGGRDAHGLDGRIPASVQPIILREARRRGLDITAEDLIMGRKN